MSNPSETPLDAPPLGITCRRETRRLTTLPAMFVFSGRNTSFDSAFRQLASESGTIKTFIGNQFYHSGSGTPALLFLYGDGCQCSASKRYGRSGCALSHKMPIGSPLPSVTSITLLPLPILVRPTPSPLFLTAQTSRPEKPLPIGFCPRGQAMRPARAKPNPKLRLLTTHQIDAGTLSANHMRLANQPTRSRFSEHIKYRSGICGYRCAVVHVPVFVVAKAAPALAIARRSNRVGS